MTVATFVATSIVVLITPGPTNTLLAASGAAFGLRRAYLFPLAEALGYALAVGAFIAVTRSFSDVRYVMPALKAVAAAWLLLSAVRLWKEPVKIDPAATTAALWRVFVTTIFNPKAMLVGTLLIPQMIPEKPATALLLYIALSTVAGLAWLTMGSMVPSSARPYAYKAAALVLGAFSVAAASSTLQGREPARDSMFPVGVKIVAVEQQIGSDHGCDQRAEYAEDRPKDLFGHDKLHTPLRYLQRSMGGEVAAVATT